MPSYDARLFLAGRYVEQASDEVLPLYSPATAEHLADVPVPTADHVDAAVSARQRRR